MNIQSETMGYLREHYKRLPVSPHQLYTWYIANIVHVDSSSGVLRLDHPDKTNNITALCCISSLVSTRCPSFTIKFYWVFLINTICQHFLCVLLCIEWPPCGVLWRSVFNTKIYLLQYQHPSTFSLYIGDIRRDQARYSWMYCWESYATNGPSPQCCFLCLRGCPFYACCIFVGF